MANMFFTGCGLHFVPVEMQKCQHILERILVGGVQGRPARESKGDALIGCRLCPMKVANRPWGSSRMTYLKRGAGEKRRSYPTFDGELRFLLGKMSNG